MRRFWTEVSVRAEPGGAAVLLDGRPLRTPGRAPLVVPGAALAEAIAEEWRAAPPAVEPRAMRLTGLANAAIDHAAPDRAAFAERLAGYAGCDTLCYRASHPEGLVARQESLWNPPLAALECRLGVRFRCTTGIEFAAQPEETLARVRAAYAALDAFRLAALSTVVALTASGILGLVLALRLGTPEEVWRAGLLEELWQAERWGEDAEAETSRALRRQAYDAAVRFLALLPEPTAGWTASG